MLAHLKICRNNVSGRVAMFKLLPKPLMITYVDEQAQNQASNICFSFWYSYQKWGTRNEDYLKSCSEGWRSRGWASRRTNHGGSSNSWWGGGDRYLKNGDNGGDDDYIENDNDCDNDDVELIKTEAEPELVFMTLKQVKRKQSKWEQIIDTVKKTAEKLPGKTNSVIIHL